MTGLPFVFAVWAARPGVELDDLKQGSRDQLREGMAALPRILDEAAADSGLPRDVLERYFTRIFSTASDRARRMGCASFTAGRRSSGCCRVRRVPCRRPRQRPHSTPGCGRGSAGRRPGWRARRGRPARCRCPGWPRPGCRPATGCGCRWSGRCRAAPPTRDPHRRAGRVLAGVGQAFLHDPVRGPPGRPPARPASLDAAASRRTSTPAARDSSASAGSSREGRLRAFRRRRRPVVVAQHPDHLAQVLQRLVGAGPDHPGRAGDLGGCRVRPDLQRAGVQAEQRDPVGQHVVHLAGDPGAFQRAGLRDPQLLLGLGALGPIAQRHARAGAGTGPPCPRAR